MHINRIPQVPMSINWLSPHIYRPGRVLFRPITQPNMEIATPQVPIQEGAVYKPRNVDTELIFWRRPADLCLVSDFTKVGREEGMAAMKNLEEEHRIQVHDVRGHESDFSLQQNGFQYAWHEIPELGGAADESQVEQFIIPQTEELVKKLYVFLVELGHAYHVVTPKKEPAHREPKHSGTASAV